MIWISIQLTVPELVYEELDVFLCATVISKTMIEVCISLKKQRKLTHIFLFLQQTGFGQQDASITATEC